MIDQYNHRLLSLEVDLQEAARTNQVPLRDYERRMKQIAVLKRELSVISQVNALESDDPFANQDADLGLPLTGSCTPAEISVVNRFLDDLQKTLAGHEKNCRSVLEWVRGAISGEPSGLQQTFRLSKLHRLTQKTLARARLVRHEAQAVDRYVEKLSKGLGKDVARGTIDGLMQVFSDLDGVISRVARLRATVKNERQRISRMVRWLEDHEYEVSASRPAMPPPTPLATAKAMAEVPAVPMLNLDSERRQLEVARGFLMKMSKKPARQGGEPLTDYETFSKEPEAIEIENRQAATVDPDFDPAAVLEAITKRKSPREVARAMGEL